MPGHGAAKTDSHKDYATVEKPLYYLHQNDFYPFIKLAKYVDFAMKAHVKYTAINCDLPITLSKKGIS